MGDRAARSHAASTRLPLLMFLFFLGCGGPPGEDQVDCQALQERVARAVVAGGDRKILLSASSDELDRCQFLTGLTKAELEPLLPAGFRRRDQTPQRWRVFIRMVHFETSEVLDVSFGKDQRVVESDLVVLGD